MKLGKVLVALFIVSILALSVYGFSDQDREPEYRWTFGEEQDNTPPLQTITLKKDTLEIKNLKNLIVSKVKNTRSMFPLIKPHAITLEKPVSDLATLQEGMIVTYRKFIPEKNEEEYIMHMIIAKKQEGEKWFFQMQGINNPEPDPVWVQGENIISEFVGVINPIE